MVGTGKPRGRVVKGVYTVHPKKTVDRGQRRKPRPRKDLGWRRSAIGPLDPYARMGMQALMPSPAYPARDPRRQSRFLGHVIDGTLGWATDIIHHIPVVGPLLGHPCRVVCRVVRAGENAVNALTGTVGVHLFILALLASLLPPTAAVTNCCSEEQVTYCTEVTCVHESGCTICQQDGNQTICWEPQGIMVSHAPSYTGVDSFLTHHIDFVAGTVFVCDLAGIKEVCGAAVLSATYALNFFPRHIQLNTTADCFLLVDSGVDPLFSSFFYWVAKELSTVATIIDFLAKIPVALTHAFTQSHFVTMCSIAGLALNGNMAKALALTILYIEAAAAAPLTVDGGIKQWNLTCPVQGTVPVCTNITSVETSPAWCFNPVTGAHRFRNTIPVDAWFCFYSPKNDVGVLRTEPGCCTVRRRPAYCNYTTDASWWDPRQTFEACGASYVLSIACSGAARQALASVLPTIAPINRTGSEIMDCFPTPVAMIDIPGMFWGPEWQQSTLILKHGHQIRYWYNTAVLGKLPPSHWARLPGTPLTYRGSWMFVPRGMYSSRRDINSGLVMKDKSHQDYQLLFSGRGSYILPGITVHIVVIALLAALGARWCLAAYALVNIFPSAFAFTPEVMAATAASGWENPAVRLFVYLTSLYREPLSIPLSATPWAFLLTFCNHVAAFSPQDILFAAASCGLLTAWAGLLSHLLPAMAMTQSYLRTRFQAACHRWLDRSVLCFFVLVAPKAVWNVCLFLWICWFGLLVVGKLFVEVFGPKDKLSLANLLRALNTVWRPLASVLRKVVVWAAGERGVFWFQHLDGSLEGEWAFTEPYYPFATEIIRAEDVGMKLACGDQIRGLPVYCRLGYNVRAGIGAIPPAWEKTAPFSFKRTHTRSQIRALALAVTGWDAANYKASVCIMGTPLRTWMGFCCNGSLYTVFHGSRGRNLASQTGPAAPRLVNPSMDLCKYPMPAGFTSLECGACACTEYFLLTKAGNLVPCSKAENRFVNIGPLTLREAKGSSGAPILCKCGKVKAMFLSCRSARGIVSSLGVLTINPEGEIDARKPTDSLTPPAVPKTGSQIERFVAPTGYGKTTKLPMEYYNKGYSVLVLNPSVATTRSVPAYMKKEYNVSPNVLTGDFCDRTGSRLTYSTYGMFLTRQYLEADVVICDEVHSVDATTVLGIGCVLRALTTSAKAKLVILATATPPGTAMQPHPNIQTVDLTDDGDFPFHGKKIKLDNLRKGRHLIFTPGKAHCDTMANELVSSGINAVAYYRGKDANAIPKDGDCVVVATDALMTGYTGNFDSVYDSCLAVQPTYEVTLNPTFQVGIRTTSADTVTRMQRRGRTGRGRPGTYYQVSPHAHPLGVVPTANVLEAFDSGLAYFGMTPAEVGTALSYYKEEPLTPAIEANLEEFIGIFISLGFVEPSHVDLMKQEAENFTYLYAAQYSVAKSAKAGPPNSERKWRGLRGTAKFPLLYDLEETDPDKVVVSSLAEKISACFEEYFASATVTLAGVGLAAAAVFAAVDLLGNIVIRQTWEKTTDSTAARVVTPELDDPTEALEECFAWDGFAESVQRASSWLGDKIVELGLQAGGKHPFMKSAEAVMPHLLAGIQYFAGMCCLQDAPGLGAVLGFVGGVLSPLPLKMSLFLTALGGAFATRLTTQRGAAAFALAGAFGASTGALGLGSIVGSAISTYGGATATCLVVLKLIDGQLPEISELASLAFNLLNPGAVIVGAASAVLIAYCTRTESQVWMNRLLAMLNRGASCEDYYVTASTLRESVIKLLERANLWSIFCEVANWMNRTDEEDCSCRGAFLAFYDACGRLLRLIVEFARGVVTRALKIPSIPILRCSKGYAGPWVGSGIVTTVCGCGAEQTWNVYEGKANWVGGSKFCSSYITGRVPVNSALVGCARPRPASWTTMAVNTGFNTYVTYKREGLDVHITGCSQPDQVIDNAVPDLLSAVMVDGVQVKPYGGEGWRTVGPYTCRLRTPREVVNLKIPFKLEPTKEPFKVEYTPPPAAIAAVSQSERCFSLSRARPVEYKKPTIYNSDSEEEQGGAALIRSLCKAQKKLADIKVEEEPVVRQRRPRKLDLEKPAAPGIFFGARTVSDGDACVDLLFPLPVRDPNLVMKIDSRPPQPLIIKKGSVVSTGSPLPGAVGGEECYSLHESSWETVESQEHSCASWSYTWSVPTLVYKGMRRVAAAVSTYTSGIMRYRPLVYATEPSSINERIRKVTIQRSRTEFPELQQAVRAAKARARAVQASELTVEEALALTSNQTAKSGVTGMTAKDLKAGKTGIVAEIYDNLEKGVVESPWNQVNIMPKSEVFVKTPQKRTKKPARIIAYPHLEMRVVEKMVLGNIGPSTVKAVCGEAYGFVTPKERVKKLLTMWEAKESPGGFTCDTTCFDSTITPEDVAVEREIYCEATRSESTRTRIRTLHDGLYQGGPMVMQGQYVGERHCRASGVFTTSSSNTMTCFLKVSAAAKKAGIRKPSWLICGDDTVCIFESESEEADKRKVGLFATYMAQMGAPQGEVPVPRYSLELLDSCSSNVSSAQTSMGLYHYITRDPRIPLARMSMEGKGFNPIGSMLGFILAHYPALWVSRVVCVKFLQELLAQEKPESITFDWYGNKYTVPLKKIPYIIQSLHGKQAWCVKQYTSREVSRVSQALRDNTVRPLRYYKRTARSVVASCRFRGGTLKFLADTLLSWVHGRTPLLDPRKVEAVAKFNFFEPYSADIYGSEPRVWTSWVKIGLFAAAMSILAWVMLAV
uniref:Genome polyprotein n=1 Tax=Rodent hepacvirus TaxID=2050015 RepID=A0A2H4MZ89_9FLAV|nr:polyprotein [Rodent hepacvirus]